VVTATALDAAAAQVDLHADLLGIVEAGILHQPRTLQRRIGPSEIGNPCQRCLAHKLAGTPERPEVGWLPYIGTCVHEMLANTFVQHEITREQLGMPPRFLSEHKVNIGPILGDDITGHADLFDTHTGTVVDFKIVGTTTLKQAKARGAKTQYATQAHLYGYGLERMGHPVSRVAIWFMPRNAISLRDGFFWEGPYNPNIAKWAMADANELAAKIRALGLPALLDTLPPHTGAEFTCKRYPDYRAPTTNPSDPFGP
jgi:hypothetical protein